VRERDKDRCDRDGDRVAHESLAGDRDRLRGLGLRERDELGDSACRCCRRSARRSLNVSRSWSKEGDRLRPPIAGYK
jgi:hypothetical protein